MKKYIYAVLLILMPITAIAQDDDFGLWTTLGAEKKLTKRFSIGAEGEMRTRNDSKTIDRWSGSMETEYKFFNWLKASAAYTFLYDNNKEKITYHSDGGYNNWRPHYWSPRHRFNVAMTGDVDFGRFNFSLREMWQYTYRPEKTTNRYDFDNAWWEPTTVSGKGKNILRSRLQVEYNIKKCKVNPYASVEIYNGWSLEKTRYTVGADWNVDKHNVFGLFYRYQDVNGSDDDNDYNSHILGLNYKFKF
jgi:hypothetical protein